MAMDKRGSFQQVFVSARQFHKVRICCVVGHLKFREYVFVPSALPLHHLAGRYKTKVISKKQRLLLRGRPSLRQGTVFWGEPRLIYGSVEYTPFIIRF